MRLVASPLFDEEDITAIEKGYETRAALAERAILRQLPPSTVIARSQFLNDRLSCLGWLVAEGRLDIKVAIPEDDFGVNGIYHEKVGLFFDQNGNIVAFTGSANETVGGLATNFESIDVFKSWDDPHMRTLNKKKNFERLWGDSTAGLRVIDFSSAVKSRILSYRSKHRPQSDPEGGIGSRKSLTSRNWTSAIGGKLSMDNSMLTALLPQHIASMKRSCSGPCLLIYQGFPIDFILGMGEAFKPLNNTQLLYSEHRLRLDSLNDICKSSIGRVVGNEHTVYVATYEELLRYDALINLNELVKYPVIIYRNNLFAEYPNLTDTKLTLIDQTVESGEPNPRPDPLADSIYAFSEERSGLQLVQYQDLQNPGTNIQYRDFFVLAPTPEETFKHADEARIPKEAAVVSDTDDRYFTVKYGVFNETWLGGRTNFDVVIDNTALKNPTLGAELMCLKSIYEANGLGMTIWVKRETRDYSYRNDFKDILNKHWHSNSFRTLAFYENPSSNSKKYLIEQGVLIEAVVQQAEKAREGEQPRDIFVTSPTGSGKSLLFQIPAIYLAENYGLITVVVSPLKALMYDQVTALQERGVRIAAYINSDVTLVDRNMTIERIKNGEVSILYLSPELLLSHDLRQFIGDQRSLGLLVVDEAHLVSTWGKDFRIDYWYLGTYIKRLRNKKYMGGQFPVLGLTATAVYGGSDDVVFETAEALNMVSPKYFIGNVRRDEVKFNIRQFNPKSGNHELVKLQRTTQVVRENISKRIKTIAYCPYVDHVNQLWTMLEDEHDLCGIYHGGIRDAYERQRVMDGFQRSQILVVIATKAFGMGIDVDDINQIYHHAPSGTLADYVQEIGRVARRKDMQGVATTDFHRKDLKFTKILWGLSKIKQYQAKYVLQKLNDLFTSHQKREMLVSVEDFNFIFGAGANAEEVENRVKSALLLIEKDLYLKAKQQYPVIMVRPKALYSVVYACIPQSIERDFLKKYGEYCRLAARVRDNKRREKRKAECTVSDVGDVYELQLKEIWENHFRQYSFPELKYRFFKRELFSQSDDVDNPYPRYRLNVILNANAGATLEKMLNFFDIVRGVLNTLGNRTFDTQELIKELRVGGFKTEASARRIANLLVSLYSGGWDVGDFGMKPGDGVLLTSAGSRDNGERLYKAATIGFEKELAWTQRKFNSMFENEQQTTFDKYISPAGDGEGYILRIAYLVEAFNLGSYELEGGRLSQIFIRINDPYKLRRAALDPRYSNSLITEVEKKHDRSGAQMEAFFKSDMTDEERWDYIESYFLGRLED